VLSWKGTLIRARIKSYIEILRCAQDDNRLLPDRKRPAALPSLVRASRMTMRVTRGDEPTLRCFGVAIPVAK
jgi:hypothetical protein